MRKKSNGLNHLPTGDLKQVAHFFRIVKNYKKMVRIESKDQRGHYTSADYPADELTEQ